eukprot:s2499_g2.t1
MEPSRMAPTLTLRVAPFLPPCGTARGGEVPQTHPLRLATSAAATAAAVLSARYSAPKGRLFRPRRTARLGSEDRDEATSVVGRRLRVWFTSEEDGQLDYEYGTVTEAKSLPDEEEDEVTIAWDGQGSETTRLSELGRYEWLGDDLAADVAANMREFRQESLEGAIQADAEVVAIPMEHLKKELEVLKWMRRELAERERKAAELRRENAELKAQREEFREMYGHLVDPSPDDTAAEDEKQRCVVRAPLKGCARAAPMKVPVVSSEEDYIKATLPDKAEVEFGLSRAAGGVVIADHQEEKRRWSISSVDGWVLGQPGPGQQWRPASGVELTLEDA